LEFEVCSSGKMFCFDCQMFLWTRIGCFFSRSGVLRKTTKIPAVTNIILFLAILRELFTTVIVSIYVFKPKLLMLAYKFNIGSL